MDFAVPADHRVKMKENEKRYKYLDLAGEMKKVWNMKVTMIQVVIGALGTTPKGLGKAAGKVGNRKKSRPHSNYNIVGDLRSGLVSLFHCISISVGYLMPKLSF